MANFEIDETTWAALNSLLDRALDLVPAERMGWIDALGAECTRTLAPFTAAGPPGSGTSRCATTTIACARHRE